MAVTSVNINTTDFAERGFNVVSWTGTNAVNHFAWRVYRRDGDARYAWELLVQRVDTVATFTYTDNTAPSGNFFYAVVEVINNAGVITEDARNGILTTTYTPYYWLIHPTNTLKTVQLRGVTAEEFKNERDTEIKQLIGRGRKVDVGDDWGKLGSVSGRIFNRTDRTARQIRLDIEDALDLGSFWYLRNPFGDVIKIWWGDPSFTRISGVGTSEYVDMSFDYQEVA